MAKIIGNTPTPNAVEAARLRRVAAEQSDPALRRAFEAKAAQYDPEVTIGEIITRLRKQAADLEVHGGIAVLPAQLNSTARSLESAARLGDRLWHRSEAQRLRESAAASAGRDALAERDAVAAAARHQRIADGAESPSPEDYEDAAAKIRSAIASLGDSGGPVERELTRQLRERLNAAQRLRDGRVVASERLAVEMPRGSVA